MMRCTNGFHSFMCSLSRLRLESSLEQHSPDMNVKTLQVNTVGCETNGWNTATFRQNIESAAYNHTLLEEDSVRGGRTDGDKWSLLKSGNYAALIPPCLQKIVCFSSSHFLWTLNLNTGNVINKSSSGCSFPALSLVGVQSVYEDKLFSLLWWPRFCLPLSDQSKINQRSSNQFIDLINIGS